MQTISQHRGDKDGFVVSAELMLIATIAVLSIIVVFGAATDSTEQNVIEVSSTIEMEPPPYDYGRLCGGASDANADLRRGVHEIC